MSPEDRNLLQPNTGPMTASDFKPAWLRNFREMALRDGINLRQGGIIFVGPSDHEPDRDWSQQVGPITIEARTPRSDWGPLNLPNNQCRFATEADRDAVFDMLQGRREIPDAP